VQVIEKGHIYKLNVYDRPFGKRDMTLVFMKRVGDKYPANENPPHEGTNCQEVIRALFNRINYLDAQIHHNVNDAIMANLEECLYLLELRAAERHGRTLKTSINDIMQAPTCITCGHIECEEHNASTATGVVAGSLS